jgi:predicted branched-subunit amino acid permease
MRPRRAVNGTAIGPVRERSQQTEQSVQKFCIFFGMTVLGWVGWWLGSMVGFMTGFLVSSAASMLGVYLGWRVYRDFLE